MAETVWKPRTKLGRLVVEGKITSIEEVFMQGYQIKEPEIVDILLPELKSEILDVTIVQRQTEAGERTRCKSIVAVGNEDGYVGVGVGKAKHVRTSIEKAIKDAKLNLIPVRRGCGSWECRCDRPHSLPFRVEGKCGSVRVILLPGPRGLGLVAGETAKIILRLAGIKDCWSRTFGQTSTVQSFAFAVYNALKQTYKMITPLDWR